MERISVLEMSFQLCLIWMAASILQSDFQLSIDALSEEVTADELGAHTLYKVTVEAAADDVHFFWLMEPIHTFSNEFVSSPPICSYSYAKPTIEATYSETIKISSLLTHCPVNVEGDIGGFEALRNIVHLDSQNAW
ncbi:hypothetical protein TSMEX_003069 [Taenia solium]|eukprot:TsM_000303600 transcript=TsM_000303600 gene=TsM_000303600